MIRFVPDPESNEARRGGVLQHQPASEEASPHPVPSAAPPAERTEVNVGPAERVISGVLGAGLTGWGLNMLFGERTAGRVIGGLAACGLGTAMLWRSATGHCSMYEALHVRGDDATATSHPLSRHIHVVDSIEIARPRRVVYDHWQSMGELTDHLRYLERVERLDIVRSRWTTRGRSGQRVSWEVQTTEDLPGERVAWRSTSASEIETDGWVTFEDLPEGRGTLLHLRFIYRPPAGAVGAAVARTSGVEAGQQVREDLRRFKSVLETGEAPTTHGQPRGQC